MTYLIPSNAADCSQCPIYEEQFVSFNDLVAEWSNRLSVKLATSVDRSTGVATSNDPCFPDAADGTKVQECHKCQAYLDNYRCLKDYIADWWLILSKSIDVNNHCSHHNVSIPVGVPWVLQVPKGTRSTDSKESSVVPDDTSTVLLKHTTASNIVEYEKMAGGFDISTGCIIDGDMDLRPVYRDEDLVKIKIELEDEGWMGVEDGEKDGGFDISTGRIIDGDSDLTRSVWSQGNDDLVKIEPEDDEASSCDSDCNCSGFSGFDLESDLEPETKTPTLQPIAADVKTEDESASAEQEGRAVGGSCSRFGTTGDDNHPGGDPGGYLGGNGDMNIKDGLIVVSSVGGVDPGHGLIEHCYEQPSLDSVEHCYEQPSLDSVEHCYEQSSLGSVEQCCEQPSLDSISLAIKAEEMMEPAVDDEPSSRVNASSDVIDNNCGTNGDSGSLGSASSLPIGWILTATAPAGQSTLASMVSNSNPIGYCLVGQSSSTSGPNAKDGKYRAYSKRRRKNKKIGPKRKKSKYKYNYNSNQLGDSGSPDDNVVVAQRFRPSFHSTSGDNKTVNSEFRTGFDDPLQSSVGSKAEYRSEELPEKTLFQIDISDHKSSFGNHRPSSICKPIASSSTEFNSSDQAASSHDNNSWTSRHQTGSKRPTCSVGARTTKWGTKQNSYQKNFLKTIISGRHDKSTIGKIGNPKSSSSKLDGAFWSDADSNVALNFGNQLNLLRIVKPGCRSSTATNAGPGNSNDYVPTSANDDFQTLSDFSQPNKREFRKALNWHVRAAGGCRGVPPLDWGKSPP